VVRDKASLPRPSTSSLVIAASTLRAGVCAVCSVHAVRGGREGREGDSSAMLSEPGRRVGDARSVVGRGRVVAVGGVGEGGRRHGEVTEGPDAAPAEPGENEGPARHTTPRGDSDLPGSTRAVVPSREVAL
jgi:hypothetical protein